MSAHFYPSDAHREASRHDESDPRHIAARLLSEARQDGYRWGWEAVRTAHASAADSATRHLALSLTPHEYVDSSVHARLAERYAHAWALLGVVKGRAMKLSGEAHRRRLDAALAAVAS